MNDDRVAKSCKQKWQSVREHYTWHLRPPFDVEFDRSQWWKGKSNVDRVAGLYELARRHPLVGDETMVVMPGRQLIQLPAILGRPFLEYIRLLRLKSWPKLTKSERTKFKLSLGKVKGLEFRGDESMCRNITELAHSEAYKSQEQRAAQSTYAGFTYIKAILRGNRLRITDPAWEEAVAHLAVQAHSQGYLLLAVAPDLSAKDAARAMLKGYGDPQNVRARWEDWLRIISEFEDAETSRQGAKSQLFARYLRIIEVVRFEKAVGQV